MNKALLWTAILCSVLLTTAASARDRDNLDRIRIEGRIESIRGQIAVIEDDCGARFRVFLGPQWYWDERDFYLRSGWYVSVVAWQDPYDDYCYAGEISGRDFCYDLCDSRGYPRWRGYDECGTDWRPTRSFFQICFVIGDPFWSCSRHNHFWDCDDHCWSGHPRRHTWTCDDDRGRGRDWDNDRDGRRGHRGGRHYVEGNNDDDRSAPRGGGNNVQIERPKDSDWIPGGEIRKNSSGGKSENSYRSPAKSYSVTKVRSETSRSGPKANTKSSRKVDSSSKTYARK